MVRESKDTYHEVTMLKGKGGARTGRFVTSQQLKGKAQSTQFSQISYI